MADQFFHTTAHFTGGLVRKGNSQNMPRINLLFFDKVDDALGENASFAGAGSGQHQDWALGRLDGGFLLGVQGIV